MATYYMHTTENSLTTRRPFIRLDEVAASTMYIIEDIAGKTTAGNWTSAGLGGGITADIGVTFTTSANVASKADWGNAKVRAVISVTAVELNKSYTIVSAGTSIFTNIPGWPTNAAVAVGTVFTPSSLTGHADWGTGKVVEGIVAKVTLGGNSNFFSVTNSANNNPLLQVTNSTITLGKGHTDTSDIYTLSVANIAAQTVTIENVSVVNNTATSLDVHVGGDSTKYLKYSATGVATYAPASRVGTIITDTANWLDSTTTVSKELARLIDVATEYSRAIVAENRLALSVSTESSRAIAAEDKLALSVSTEGSRAIVAENQLALSVSTESSRAIVAENRLALSVSTEGSRAIAAENQLALSVSTESSRAIVAENRLALSVSTESSRAIVAENQLALSVSTEGSRAIAAENALLAYINNYMTGDNIAENFVVSGTFSAANTATYSITAVNAIATAATIDNLITNNSTGYSDARLKKDIENVTDATAKINALRPVFYNWNDKPSLNPDFKELGFIAQEVEVVLPHVVRTLDDEIGTKAVAYDRIVSLLVAALKEHDIRITALEHK